MKEEEKNIEKASRLNEAYRYLFANYNIKSQKQFAEDIRVQRTFDAVPVKRNRITTYEGKLFGDGEWTATMTDFSFVVNADWDGEVVVGF